MCLGVTKIGCFWLESEGSDENIYIWFFLIKYFQIRTITFDLSQSILIKDSGHMKKTLFVWFCKLTLPVLRSSNVLTALESDRNRVGLQPSQTMILNSLCYCPSVSQNENLKLFQNMLIFHNEIHLIFHISNNNDLCLENTGQKVFHPNGRLTIIFRPKWKKKDFDKGVCCHLPSHLFVVN